MVLPEDMKLTETGGIYAKIRYTGEGTIPRIFLFDMPSGAGYLSKDAFMDPFAGLKEGEGTWYVIVIPFTAFKHNSSTPPPPDGALDFNRLREISFGFNTDAQTATLEIEELWVYE